MQNITLIWALSFIAIFILLYQGREKKMELIKKWNEFNESTVACGDPAALWKLSQPNKADLCGDVFVWFYTENIASWPLAFLCQGCFSVFLVLWKRKLKLCHF